LRIIFLRRRILRLLLLVLIMIFILPLLHFFITSAVNPASVHFREPLGDAIKVFDPDGENQSQLSIISRVIYYIREFYQNKL
jgi:hypothetical protein